MGKIKFYDTNALLDLKDIKNEDYFIISSITLEELENIKTSRSKDEEIKYQARLVTRFLSENSDRFEVVFYNNDIANMLYSTGVDETPDAKIASCAKHISEIKDIIFVTGDMLCGLIAKHIYGLNIISKNDISENDAYKGFKEIVLSDEDMAYLYQNPTVNKYDLLENEYLIIRNHNNEIVDKLKWVGDIHQVVKVPTLKSNYFGNTKPYNGDIYQQLVLNSLLDNQLTMIKGSAGTGKSYLALSFLFSLLEKKKIDKIVIFANPTPTLNSAKIGFLPGSQLDKLVDSSVGNMLSSKLGDKYAIEQLVSQNKLSILPMCDIRGFDTTGLNCGVYITEAQNMDISLMKLALQRIGEDSICVVEGDYNAQVDLGQYSGSNNGMRRMSEVFRGHDFYGEVELQNIYRGKIARIAEEM